MSREKNTALRRALRMAGMAAAALIVIALFYLLLLVVEPADPPEETADQPLMTASPALHAASEDELPDLLRGLPMPVLAFLSGAGPDFADAASYDTAFEDGFARVVDLRYRIGENTVLARTIYPARAVSLIGRQGYTLTGEAVRMAGMAAIRMVSADTIRLHCTTEHAVYVLEVPRMSSDVLTALLQSTQLVYVDE